MIHVDHVNLLRDAGIQSNQVWADLGAGTGAFTLALADLMRESGTLYAVDRDGAALRQQSVLMKAQFPAITLHYVTADFTTPLTLPPLDGIVMANALHFVAAQVAVIRTLKRYLRPEGRLVLVEYNTDQGNQWVPYPFSYPNWERLAAQGGFAHTRKLASRPSRFLGEIYSAVSW